LEQVRRHDPRLAGLADRLAELSYLAADLAGECASYADGVESDPIRLDAVEDRRATLATLTRAYGDTADAVLEWARRSSERLLELDGDDERVAALQHQRGQLQKRLGALAATISQARCAAAERLAAQVTPAGPARDAGRAVDRPGQAAARPGQAGRPAGWRGWWANRCGRRRMSGRWSCCWPRTPGRRRDPWAGCLGASCPR
jgi:hypothetical protein